MLQILCTHGRKLNGFAQRLLMHSLEHRATKKPEFIVLLMVHAFQCKTCTVSLTSLSLLKNVGSHGSLIAAATHTEKFIHNCTKFVYIQLNSLTCWCGRNGSMMNLFRGPLAAPTYQANTSKLNQSTILMLSHKCGFPSAEEQKKWNKYFSRMAGSLGSSVGGGGLGHMAQGTVLLILLPFTII